MDRRLICAALLIAGALSSGCSLGYVVASAERTRASVEVTYRKECLPPVVIAPVQCDPVMEAANVLLQYIQIARLVLRTGGGAGDLKREIRSAEKALKGARDGLVNRNR